MKLALCVFICLAGSAASWGQEPKLVRVLRGHKSSVIVVVFSPDSKLLASSQDGGEVRLWEVSSGKNLGILYKGGDHYGSLAFSPDGKILAGGHDCRWVSLWDVGKRTQFCIIRARSRFPRRWPAVAFQTDGKTLVWRSCDSDDNDSENQEIVFTNVATLKNTGAVKVNIGRHGLMTFSPDCRLFAVGGLRGGDSGDVSTLYETGTGKKLTAFKGHSDSNWDLIFSPDGSKLAAAIDETVKLWDVATGKHIATFTGAGKYASCVAFSPDGKTLAFGSLHDPVVELWNVAAGKKLYTLRGKGPETDGVDSIAFSPDGKMLAAGREEGAGSRDETIELWDIGSADKLNTTSAEAKK